MEEIIEELTKVSPDKLSKDGLKLFEKINEIIDENKQLKLALVNSVSKDEIKAKIEEFKYREENVVQYTDNKVILYAIQKVLQELLNKGE